MLLKKIKLLKWSLRKLQLPIGLNDKVVEIGSGGNPHPASHVLVEKFMDNSHRLKSIRIDRQTILADGEALPFIDKAFDFSIAFHVLEHVPNPLVFAAELCRVSKAGYIETPNVLYERFHPFNVHLLEVAKHGDMLIISKKQSAEHDKIISAADILSDKNWRNIFETRPELFHVCHTWRDSINITVINPEQSTDWHDFPSAGASQGDDFNGVVVTEKPNFRQIIINSIRFFYKRFSTVDIDIKEILACPNCKQSISFEGKVFCCQSCGDIFSAYPVFDFTKPIGNKEVSNFSF